MLNPNVNVGADDVVVDRLRHADDRQTVLAVELAGDRQRSVPADDDQRLETHVGERRLDLLDAAWSIERTPASSPEHGAAAREHPAHRLDRERDGAPLTNAVPGVEESDHLVAVVAFGLAHDGADHGVESGAVASAGEHADSHPVRICDEYPI